MQRVGIIPPDVIADPVYDPETGSLELSPDSLLLPGEAVRWSGRFYYACPRCWEVFSLSNHNVDVDDYGTISVEESIICPACGLHAKFDNGKIITEGLENESREKDWEEIREQRIRFTHQHREEDVERLLSRKYRDVMGDIELPGDD